VISGLSDRELLSRVRDLVSRERAVTLEVLLHLIEVGRRRLHLGLGCPSMFEYCTRHLGYSSSAASRRIHTARCIRDYPEVYGLLEMSEVNLSTVSLVASILTKENKGDLLMRIRNKSQKEVEAIVADYKPPVSLRDRARPACVAAAPLSPGASGWALSGTPTSISPGGNPASLALGSGSGNGRVPTQTERPSGCDYSRCGSEKTPNMAGGPPRFERKFQVQFLASERFMKKFEKAKALLSNKNRSLSCEAVLEAALDEFLKDHDPDERNKRREERKTRARASDSPPKRPIDRADHPSEPATAASARRGSMASPRNDTRTREEGPTRYIPAATRDAVFTRDKGRCTYVGSSGERCEATRNLEFDHIVPVARGGANVIGNLRLLCERHNKLEAERILGASTNRRFRRRA
jgi:5-methylcytosine-specific restriction endonuclease McrA